MESQTSTESTAPVAAAPAPAVRELSGVDTVGGVPVASAGKRLGAYLLEGVLVVCTLFIGWVIWSLVLWGQGQSPAKKLLGLRVVKLDTGKAATRGTMALRELIGKPVGSAFILFIVSVVMLLGASHQGLWDKIAGTVVVEDKDGKTV